MNENKNNINYLGNKIDNLSNKINNFQQFKNNNNNDIKINTIKNCNNGKYIGEIKNGIGDGKGIFYFNNGDKLKVIIKMD